MNFQRSFRLWQGEWMDTSGCGVLLGYYRSGPGNDDSGIGLSSGNEDGKKEKITEYMVEVNFMGLGTDVMWEGWCSGLNYDF